MWSNIQGALMLGAFPGKSAPAQFGVKGSSASRDIT